MRPTQPIIGVISDRRTLGHHAFQVQGEKYLRAVVTAAVERLRPQADDAGVELLVRMPGAPVPVAVDSDRFAQVVTNLVGNAMRATDAGGRIDVEVSTDGATASVAVAVCALPGSQSPTTFTPRSFA